MPVKRKSDVLAEIMRSNKLAENQCNAQIKILRTDNGTEYTNKKFEDYLADCGIQHQKTAPYTPEQNGVAERMNRTRAGKMYIIGRMTRLCLLGRSCDDSNILFISYLALIKTYVLRKCFRVENHILNIYAFSEVRLLCMYQDKSVRS